MDKKKETLFKKLFKPSKSGCCSIQIISEDEENDIGEKHKKAAKKEENQDKS
ncbi:MAG TPA: hypothetical protein GXX35_14535 [Thermoanaerobacterales bacterium]|nr:hypothetical protein [Thermoanaerobacterales bacterium]